MVIPSLKPEFEKALGREIAPSSLYRMLARHGWRKLAPDTVRPKGDLDSLVLPRVNQGCMGLYLAEKSRRCPSNNIVVVLDGAGWHKNKSMPIPDYIRLLSLPLHSPELNPVAHL